MQKMNMLRCLSLVARSFALVLTIAFLALQPAPDAKAATQLKLHTDQEMIEELMQPSDLDVTNIDAVFEAVFQALQSKVTVYPTESYYYFTFPIKASFTQEI